MGFPRAEEPSPILPIILGSTEKTMKTALEMKTDKKKAFWVSAIRPPTVPKGSSRLRCSLQLTHKKSDLKDFFSKLKTILKKS